MTLPLFLEANCQADLFLPALRSLLKPSPYLQLPAASLSLFLNTFFKCKIYIAKFTLLTIFKYTVQ